MPKNRIHYHYFLLYLLVLSGCSEQGTLPPQAIADNNQAVALMGQFDYKKAQSLFRSVSDRHPNNPDFQTNVAIALLNRQQEGDHHLALALLAKVLQAHPEHLEAQYCSGILQLHGGHPKLAGVHFQKVVEQDPSDAYATYYLGQTLAQNGQFKQALDWYQQAIRLDPYLRSAYYAAFQSLQRSKKPDQARTMLKNYQRLQHNPQARLAEIKYTRMGPKCEAKLVGPVSPRIATVPRGALFKKPIALPTQPSKIQWTPDQANFTAADLNHDGHLDLFLAQAMATSNTPNAVFMGQSNGLDFQLDSTHPLAQVPMVNSVLWGDIDNNGLVDAYLLRQGLNQLWMQTQQGWRNQSQPSQSAGGDQNTVDGALFDADHDGDLDLFLVNQNGPNRLLHNRLDGTFVELNKKQGLAGIGQARQVAIVDLDHDRDADIIVLNAVPPHEVYLNDRLWEYHRDPRFQAFESSPIQALVPADMDTDGQTELYSVDTAGKVIRWQPDKQGQWTSQSLSPAMGATALAIFDFDGDTQAEFLVRLPQGIHIKRLAPNQAPKTLFTTQQPLYTYAIILPTPEHGPALLGMGVQGPQLYLPGSGRFPFVGISFSGKEEKANAMRSNASGIGTRHALRIGSHWSTGTGFRYHSGPGQSLQPWAAGLGGAAKADFVAIYWSDGVYQTEIGLVAGKRHHITETQRQLSSCPVLFAWNGQKFGFISDLLGVGGLGYAIAPGVYAKPRPRESFLLPPNQLQAYRGRYLFKLSEPMEEVAYLDAARLVQYDLPPGWHMGLDERMGIQGPVPSGKPFYYRTQLQVQKAFNERGQEVTKTLRTADLQAAPLGPLDSRFIGRLAQQHRLELHFSQNLDVARGQPWLVAEGWIEYPYSQTSFAAWQARAEFQAPTLEARSVEGPWQIIWEAFGYPAGMPRQMALRLDNLPKGSSQLRLRSNQEIYWDRIRIVYAEDPPINIKIQTLPLQVARLNSSGFAKRSDGPQRQPSYDYNERQPLWDTRHMAGYYSAFGPVTELLQNTEDAVAIMGPGEEIHMEFLANSTPPAPGWRRQLVLETNGWAKDMDLFTQHGETVEPLPSTGKPKAQREQLHRRFNTRYRSGR